MFQNLYHRAMVAFYGLLVPTEDAIAGGFSRLQKGISKAEARAQAHLTAEMKLRDASYARQEAARRREIAQRDASYGRDSETFSILARAQRVSGRIAEFLA
ncbi:hypothetical protein [Sphingomonas asaccharolytica]|uniref:hypothetical protein n=1 Tax=Sphingomonas asaccharolytica TaxID=40681 RepID=UPI000B2B38BD|nr:hypothetical protein [Sphingomonas asaccharolytica]